MAELGQTLDPRQLVPGDPAAIAADLRALVGTIEQVAKVGSDLGSVDVVDWTGQAAAAFRGVFGEEPPKWLRAVEDLGFGGEALAGYGDVLTWAQGQAQQAIEIHTQAMAASRAAASQALAQAQSGVVGPFFDPAADMFHNAQTMLSNAREQLAAAGGNVAQAFGLQPDGEGNYTRSTQDRLFGVENGKPGWRRTRAGRSYQREHGSMDQTGLNGRFNEIIGGALKALGIEIPEGEWKAGAEAKVWGGEISGEFDDGYFKGNGSLSADALGAAAEAHAKWGQDGLTAGASAEAYLAKAAAEGKLAFGDDFSLNGKGEAFVGASAETENKIGWTGVETSAEAFAGAKVEGSVGAEVAGVGAGVHGEAWAGIGAQASAQVGMGNDGNFHLGGSLGLGFGVGGKVGFDFSVNPGEVVDTVGDVANDIGDGINSAANAVDRGVSDAANAVGDFLGL
ncbi:MAG: putative T7SS-secreted protein [Kibdelosporangium sp.]